MTASTTTYRPFTCADAECRRREAAGKRCPWCWGGFPVDADPICPYCKGSILAPSTTQEGKDAAEWHARAECVVGDEPSYKMGGPA